MKRLMTLGAVFYLVAQTSWGEAGDSLFGSEQPRVVQQASGPLWSSKDEFIMAASKGAVVEALEEMKQKSGDEYEAARQRILDSVTKILATGYGTPVPDKGSAPNCPSAFRDNIPDLLQTLAEYKTQRLGDNPPDFINTDEIDTTWGRTYFKQLATYCSKNIGGIEKPYPFIGSLESLLKEYGDATEGYVNGVRSERVLAYQEAQQKAASEKAAMAAEEDARRKQRFAEEEVKRSSDNKLKACIASVDYKRYEAAKNVGYYADIARNARQGINKENEIGKVSGYVNSSRLNELGRTVVSAEEGAKSSFIEYKRNGGVASSMNGVVAGKNPCQ